MALIVEDGSIVAGAESYISVVEAADYLTGRGDIAFSALALSEQESALRRATDYLTQKYRTRWRGERAVSSQSLDWPRQGVVTPEGELSASLVPLDVKRACAEMAVRAISSVLNPDIDPAAAVTKEKVGPVEVEYLGVPAGRLSYQAVDGLLSVYVSSAAVASVVRG